MMVRLTKYLGTPYLWGGDSWQEGGFDASGFVWHYLTWETISDIGERTTVSGLAEGGRPIDGVVYQPCDLLFPKSMDDVVMWVGGGEGIEIVHVSMESKRVRYDNLYFEPAMVRRYLSA